MKKIIRSIIAFVLVSTIIFSGLAPVTVLALNADGADTEIKESIFQVREDVSSIDVPISERYHVIENGYLGKYDLQEGIFGHQSAKQVNKTAVYFYSDGYFADAPEIYNPSLSSMSLSLAISCFNAMRTDFDLTMPQGAYSNLFRHVKVLMSDIGIADKDIFVNDSFDVRPTKDTIGMIMGAKNIVIEGKEYILMPIAVRGGDYEAEWASNVTLGASGEAYGFSSAATQVLEQIESYIDSNTSFDIPSALSEGRVKFWVVGYSRGGAVANLTAKRLTDIYGETENSVYAYTFEAPNCGTDASAVNEPWTYDGIYANIHNIINPCDLVTLIPPKQMGFKRYGVDHYSPGSEAGEITATVYKTPTGINVTTYADNTPYFVGDDGYGAMRAEMLLHLASIDSNITFSDSFALVAMDILNALLKWELFIPIEEGAGVNAREWLETFIGDLQEWAANGTYSQGSNENGGYNGDYRDFFTSNIEFSGEDRVSLENALQCILDLAFSLYYDEEFTDALSYRAVNLLLEYRTLLDLILNAAGKWSDLTKEQQVKYSEIIWEYLNGDMERADGTAVKKITDFVTDEERELLKDSVYTLSAFLFLFLNRDGNTSPSFDGVKTTQVHIATLIGNAMTVVQGHYPEICFAWLRTCDANYSSDNENAIYKNIAVNLINDENNALPEVEADIDVEDGKTAVALSSIIRTDAGIDANSYNNGSAIYYAIYENGKMTGAWQLYRAPIVIDTSNDTEYTVKAFAVRFEEKGAEVEITNEQLRPAKDDSDLDDGNIQDQNSPTISKKDTIITVVIVAIALILVTFIVLLIVKKHRKIKK